MESGGNDPALWLRVIGLYAAEDPLQIAHTQAVADYTERIAEMEGCSERRIFLLKTAALLHDIGKPETTRERRGKITSYDHDKAGMRLAREFLSALTDDYTLIERVGRLVRYHMQPFFVVKGLPFAEVGAMKRETDVREVALLGYGDRMGRTNSSSQAECACTREFLQKCGAGDVRLEL
ncbi:hypothetical protein SDC9_179769 [bioreactor metagenome]|uniref:HD/PDEase domain-containing protein n=1 Tax=bioreactor metagenome TaxID=1076179 RepID=A0A645GZR0_9ZZZZ